MSFHLSIVVEISRKLTHGTYRYTFTVEITVPEHPGPSRVVHKMSQLLAWLIGFCPAWTTEGFCLNGQMSSYDGI